MAGTLNRNLFPQTSCSMVARLKVMVLTTASGGMTATV
jgi:hypothetical protein